MNHNSLNAAACGCRARDLVHLLYISNCCSIFLLRVFINVVVAAVDQGWRSEVSGQLSTKRGFGERPHLEIEGSLKPLYSSHVLERACFPGKYRMLGDGVRLKEFDETVGSGAWCGMRSCQR